MDDNNLNEIYQLWIEYLKRSEPYKTLCEYVTQKRTLPLAPIPDELKGMETLMVNYLMFGDIHKQTFQETLFKIESWKEIFSSISSPIEDYSGIFEFDFDRLIERFKKVNRREPNIQEIKSDLLHLMKQSSLIYLRVNLSGAKMKDLIQRFSEILKEKKNQIKSIPSLTPTPNIRLDELKKYLTVYTNREQTNKTYKDIASIINFSSGDNTVREMQRFYDKAKNIIDNVERGIFPGKY